MTATVTSLNLKSFSVVAGQDTLTFGPVAPNSQVTSSNTILLLVNPAVPFDLSNLQWTFQVTPVLPVANAGPNQACEYRLHGDSRWQRFDEPSGIGTITYAGRFEPSCGKQGQPDQSHKRHAILRAGRPW